MFGTAQSLRITRNAVSVCLALLLSVASLAPLAFGDAAESTASCCRGHGKCCCKKSHAKAPVGPQLSNPQCADGCCQPATDATTADRLVRPSCRWIAPGYRMVTRLSAFEPDTIARISGDAQRQRPPPTSSLHAA